MNTRNTRGKLVHQRILHHSDEVLYFANSCNSTQMTLSEDSWDSRYSFSGCASYLAFRTVTSARKNYQNSFSSSKFTLRHNCASATEDTHQKSPFVFLYLAHLPLQNVKTKQNMVPEVATYDLGQNQQAMHSSPWHTSLVQLQTTLVVRWDLMARTKIIM